MVAIIIAAHGESAPALLGSTTMIVGDVDNVHAVTFVPGQGPDDLLEAYGNAIGDSDDDVLILVDLKAGSTGVRAFKAGKPAKPAQTSTPQNAEAESTASTSEATEIDPNFPRDPNATMKVAALRIDSRLIHGQVAGAWVSYVAPQTLIAASDSAASDELRKTLLLQVGPASARTNVLDIAKTIRVYFNPEYKDMRTMIVVESPMDALKLLEAGVTVDEVDVGGVTFKPGMTLITEAVSVNDEHVEAYKAINDLGVTMTLQQVPTSSRTDMMSKLKEKGLLA